VAGAAPRDAYATAAHGRCDVDLGCSAARPRAARLFPRRRRLGARAGPARASAGRATRQPARPAEPIRPCPPAARAVAPPLV